MAFSIDQRKKPAPNSIVESEGKQYRVNPDGVSVTPLEQPAYPIGLGSRSNLEQSQLALASSQRLIDQKQVFTSPLHNIATGQSQDNLESAKGAGKQALADFASAGAQNAGPIGQGMLDAAPGLKPAFEALKQVTQPTNMAQSQGAAQTTMAGMLAPMPTGAKVSPFLGGITEKVGQGMKAAGKILYDFVIPRSTKEAQLLQSYKAGASLPERMGVAMKDAPRTSADTAFDQGIKGTESMIGVQANAASKKIWKEVIEPQLDEAKVDIDMGKFFDDIAKDISTETGELSRRGDLLEALQALREPYAGKPKATLKELQDFKKGWAEHVPQKAYQGKDIAGAFTNVKDLAADKARKTIYETLGPDVQEAYIDYGNLQSLKELGVKAMTGGRLKGGFGGFWSGVKDMTLTPIATIGGQVLYKTGDGLEFIGNAGARTLADLEIAKFVSGLQEDLLPTDQAESTAKLPYESL